MNIKVILFFLVVAVLSSCSRPVPPHEPLADKDFLFFRMPKNLDDGNIGSYVSIYNTNTGFLVFMLLNGFQVEEEESYYDSKTGILHKNSRGMKKSIFSSFSKSWDLKLEIPNDNEIMINGILFNRNESNVILIHWDGSKFKPSQLEGRFNLNVIYRDMKWEVWDNEITRVFQSIGHNLR